MSKKIDKNESKTPVTNALIAMVMAQHPTDGLSDRGIARAMAKYFDAVHQELAPLCRQFEAENRALRDRMCNPMLKAGIKANSLLPQSTNKSTLEL